MRNTTKNTEIKKQRGGLLSRLLPFMFMSHALAGAGSAQVSASGNPQVSNPMYCPNWHYIKSWASQRREAKAKRRAK